MSRKTDIKKNSGGKGLKRKLLDSLLSKLRTILTMESITSIYTKQPGEAILKEQVEGDLCSKSKLPGKLLPEEQTP